LSRYLLFYAKIPTAPAAEISNVPALELEKVNFGNMAPAYVQGALIRTFSQACYAWYKASTR